MRITPATNRTILAVALATAIGIGFAANEAHALEPPRVEVGLKAGGGTNWTGQSPDPIGFSIGGRAGASIHVPDGDLYAGVEAVYYAGSSGLERCGFCGTSESKVSAHSFQYGADIGYGRKVSTVTIRGQAGLGEYGLDGSAWYGALAGTKRYLYVEPSLVGLISIGNFFVGADVGALLLFMGPNNQAAGSPADSLQEPAVRQAGFGFVANGQVGVTL